jgi:hypothetical protein
MKAYLSFIFLLFTIAGHSQNSINNYKYVLVPARFDFSGSDNQYGLNSTTKQLLEEKGFTAFVGDDELPSIVAANKCNALKAEVTQRKGLFATNLTLILKDCQGNIIFKSKEGKSREKEFQTAYDLALRDAFVSLKSVPYHYDSTVFTQTQQRAATPGVPASASAASLTQASMVPAAPAAPAAPVALPTPAAPASSAVIEITGTLYAQAIPNGYQVIDTTPKKVLTLLKTSIPDYFIAESGVSNGIVFKKDGAWYFEYYKDNKLVSKMLEIKF